jgi:hypothetical protein
MGICQEFRCDVCGLTGPSAIMAGYTDTRFCPTCRTLVDVMTSWGESPGRADGLRVSLLPQCSLRRRARRAESAGPHDRGRRLRGAAQGYRASWPTAQAYPGAASSSAAALTAMTWRAKVVRARRRRPCSSALRQPLDLSHPDGRTCGLGCLGVP